MGFENFGFVDLYFEETKASGLSCRIAEDPRVAKLKRRIARIRGASPTHPQNALKSGSQIIAVAAQGMNEVPRLVGASVKLHTMLVVTRCRQKSSPECQL